MDRKIDGQTMTKTKSGISHHSSMSAIGNHFHCNLKGHDDSPLNIVCIEQDCDTRGLICNLCSHHQHPKHETLPLQIFLEKYQQSINYVNKSSQLLSIDLDHLNSIEDKILKIINDFQLRMLEAIQWTKNHLNSHFLQQVNIFQSMQIRRSQAQQVFQILQGNFIKNSFDLRDYIYRLVSQIGFGETYNESPEIFQLTFYPPNITEILKSLVQQTKNTMLQVEMDIQSLSEVMASGLNAILKAKISLPSPQKKIFGKTTTYSQFIPDKTQILDLKSIKAHSNTIRDLIDLEQNFIASCSYDQRIKIWKKSEGTLYANLDGHTDEVYQLAYSKKNQILASSSYDRTIKLWMNVEGQWKNINNLKGHSGKTWAIVFVDTSNQLISSSNDQQIILWNIFTAEKMLTLEGVNDTIWSFLLLQSTNQLVSGDTKHVRIWDHSEGTQSAFFEAHQDRIYQMAEHSVGQNRVLITSSIDQTVKFWNLASTYDLLKTIQCQFRVTTIFAIPERNSLIIGSWGDNREGKIQMWQLNEGVKEHDIAINLSGVSQILYDKKLQKLLSAHADGTISFFSINFN